MTINPSVAELFVLQEQGSGTFIAGNEVLTASHVAQAIGDTVAIEVGGIYFDGIVTHIAPNGPGPGAASETPTQVGNDYAVISLTTAVEPSISISTNIVDGGAGTKIGYPGVSIGGIVQSFGVQQQEATTIQIVTNVPNLVVDNVPMIQGSSGGALLNSAGQLVGVLDAIDNQYQYSAAMTPYNANVISGWVAQDATINNLYHTALNRPGDLVATPFYEATTLASAASGFLNSSEFMNAHPGITYAQEIPLFYEQGLGRLPTASETSWWLQANTSSVVLLAGIAASPEAIAHWSNV